MLTPEAVSARPEGESCGAGLQELGASLSDRGDERDGKLRAGSSMCKHLRSFPVERFITHLAGGSAERVQVAQGVRMGESFQRWTVPVNTWEVMLPSEGLCLRFPVPDLEQAQAVPVREHRPAAQTSRAAAALRWHGPLLSSR